MDHTEKTKKSRQWNSTSTVSSSYSNRTFRCVLHKERIDKYQNSTLNVISSICIRSVFTELYTNEHTLMTRGHLFDLQQESDEKRVIPYA